MTRPASPPTVVQAIGRWSLAALVLNTIIGTGVFVLPGTLGASLGWSSMWAWLIAAGLTGTMVFSFAEVASRFSRAGGAYLYGTAAFGSFVGIQMAWMGYFVRCITAAVQANLFTTYLVELWPAAASRPAQVAVTFAFIGLQALVNIRSVGSGAAVSNVFAIVKLVPLIVFGTLGIAWLAMGKAAPSVIGTGSTLGSWLDAMVLLMFAYGGFESALIPMAEAKDARRDAPFALIAGLALVTVVYLAAQLTVLVTLTEPGATNRPLAASARVMFGGSGAVIITAAALISVYGWVASNMLNVPRLTMAMAEQGVLPSFFAKIHPKFRTPWISIIVFAVISLALALQADLLRNLSLSAVSRLLLYGGVCASLLVFRSRDARGVSTPGVEPALFRVKGGPFFATVGVLLSLLLATRMTGSDAIKMAVVIALGGLHWWFVHARRGARGVG